MRTKLLLFKTLNALFVPSVHRGKARQSPSFLPASPWLTVESGLSPHAFDGTVFLQILLQHKILVRWIPAPWAMLVFCTKISAAHVENYGSKKSQHAKTGLEQRNC